MQTCSHSYTHKRSLIRIHTRMVKWGKGIVTHMPNIRYDTNDFNCMNKTYHMRYLYKHTISELLDAQNRNAMNVYVWWERMI